MWCVICGVWRVVVYGIMMVWWCHWLGVWCGGGAGGGVCHIQLDSIGFDSCSKRCTGQVPPKGAPVPYPRFRLDLIRFDSIRLDSTRAPNGARDRSPQKGHLSRTLGFDST